MIFIDNYLIKSDIHSKFRIVIFHNLLFFLMIGITIKDKNQKLDKGNGFLISSESITAPDVSNGVAGTQDGAPK